MQCEKIVAEPGSNLKQCSIGLFDNSECHLTTYTFRSTEIGFKLFRSFSAHEQQLLLLRSDCILGDTSEICYHHEAVLLTKYEMLHRYCCNPFLKKNHHRSRDLRTVRLSDGSSERFTKFGIKPGQKLCRRCQSDLAERFDDGASVDENYVEPTDYTEKVDSSCAALGISPLKFGRYNKRTSLGYAKRKIEQIESTLAENVALAGGLNPEDVHCQHRNDLDDLIRELKGKMSVSNRSEKIQLLTLIPKSWSNEKVALEFRVSERVVKQARDLKTEKGILAVPDRKVGHPLSEAVIDRVQKFYEDDEFSRICPGKKDYVILRTNGKKDYKQKRLMLCNLRELHKVYCERNGVQLGFSKFCTLRPKWCVMVGSAGSHSVCVCTIHQNIKLMLDAAPLKDDYKQLMSKTVCNMKSKSCMLHRCEQCPGAEGLESMLADAFAEFDPDELIKFKQWVQTDRADLEDKEMTTEEFIDDLTNKIWNLSCHHYVAKHQSEFLKTRKENLQYGEIVIQMDFAENYSFLVQDAAQGFHWNNSQATVHPFVIYYKSMETQSLSCCVISDSLKHDTVAVHVFLEELLKYLRTVIGDINHIYYFSDGSAAQYKNFKNFLNLCFHKNDFGSTAEWNFFATSHGKSACDGVGGMTKRAAMRASLQRPKHDQILTPKDLFEFCDKQISGVKFFFVSKDTIESKRSMQENRFHLGSTVAGTRDNHQFVPIDENFIKVYRVSGDETSFIATVNQFALKHSNVSFGIRVASLQPGEYVACVYEKNWFVGIIEEVSDEHHDVSISFMHPPGIASSFHWPARKDLCWVPEQHIIAVLPAPDEISRSGRNVSLPKEIMSAVDNKFNSK